MGQYAVPPPTRNPNESPDIPDTMNLTSYVVLMSNELLLFVAMAACPVVEPFLVTVLEDTAQVPEALPE
jgi:hypothetical protein